LVLVHSVFRHHYEFYLLETGKLLRISPDMFMQNVYLMIQKRHVTRVSLVELFYLVTMLHDDCSVCQQHLIQVNTTCKQQQQRSKCLSLSLGVSQSASKLTSFLSPIIQSETNAQTQATLQPTTNDFVLVLFIGNGIGKHLVQ